MGSIRKRGKRGSIRDKGMGRSTWRQREEESLKTKGYEGVSGEKGIGVSGDKRIGESGAKGVEGSVWRQRDWRECLETKG